MAQVSTKECKIHLCAEEDNLVWKVGNIFTETDAQSLGGWKATKLLVKKVAFALGS